MKTTRRKNIKLIINTIIDKSSDNQTPTHKIGLNQTIHLKECFICLESDDYVCNLSSLNKLYWTTCVCKGDIHFICLHKWLYVKKRCPLCKNIYSSKLSWLCKKMLILIFHLTKCFLFVSIMFVCYALYNIIIRDTILYG